MNKHKDCKFFEEDTCILKRITVPADGNACKAFEPKEV